MEHPHAQEAHRIKPDTQGTMIKENTKTRRGALALDMMG
jgi:hypothetical protein